VRFSEVQELSQDDVITFSDGQIISWKDSYLSIPESIRDAKLLLSSKQRKSSALLVSKTVYRILRLVLKCFPTVSRKYRLTSVQCCKLHIAVGELQRDWMLVQLIEHPDNLL